MIQLSHFSFWAPATDVQLLYDLNLEIKRSEFAIVLGPSGSGKSSWLSASLGYIRTCWVVARRALGASLG